MNDIQTSLMDFPVPYHVDPVSAQECDETCPCDMTNIRYPLRLPCRYSKMVLTACPETCDDEGFHLHPKPVHQEDCTHCVNGFSFNPSADALWEAVRAKGWKVVVATGLCNDNQPGDDVTVIGNKNILGFVDYGLGLRGQAALEMVLWKAKESW
ncbi:hypothetical protein LCGC14_0378520 [marine sediment metagenome]|uniref:Uncharacterized protein n=1 Tax=marine sediment metagenome TaxID=412755 RepID=A0A0F9T8Q7_9ZZZZ